MTGPIPAHVLEDGDVRIRQLAMGCATQRWQIGDQDAILGYRNAEAYRDNPASLGVIVGRVANRIGGAAFSLDGVRHRLAANDGTATLHGGPQGLSRRIWAMDPDGPRRVRLRCTSPDGDQGFPGTLTIEVTLTLTGHSLHWDITATPDRPTPVGLAQHNYYALGGDCRTWTLTLPASRTTPTNAALIPTGEIASVTPEIDFRTRRQIGGPRDINLIPDAIPWEARLDGEALSLHMQADQPGVQLYTAHGLAAHHAPLPGQSHTPFSAACLEPQGWPDAVNHAAFPSIIATPDQPYRQSLTVTITPN